MGVFRIVARKNELTPKYATATPRDLDAVGKASGQTRRGKLATALALPKPLRTHWDIGWSFGARPISWGSDEELRTPSDAGRATLFVSPLELDAKQITKNLAEPFAATRPG